MTGPRSRPAAYDRAAPASPLWEQVRGWFRQTLERAGVGTRMSLRLHETFVRVWRAAGS